jgi:hypothetical protein
MPSSPAWNGQLNHVLLDMGDQKVVEPRQVLLSMLRALHVVRAVLQEVSCCSYTPLPSPALHNSHSANTPPLPLLRAPAAMATSVRLQPTVRLHPTQYSQSPAQLLQLCICTRSACWPPSRHLGWLLPCPAQHQQHLCLRHCCRMGTSMC